jgi:4-amino-4-deoxy-L-arabinose transferase-like glycosyltransferase
MLRKNESFIRSPFVFKRIVWFELVIVAFLLVMLFVLRLENIPHFADESDWIANSQFMEAYFTGKFDPSGFHAVWGWGETYYTLDHPMLARYLIGFGRRTGGFQVKDINILWDWSKDVAGNQAAGHVPGPRLLWWSRLPMAILAGLSGAIGFWLMGRLTGRLGAYIFAALFGYSAYFQNQLSRAMSESSLLFFTLWAVVVTIFLIKNLEISLLQGGDYRSSWKTLGWAALAGIMVGLAGASKINGLFSVGGVGLVILWVIFKSPGPTTTRLRIFLAIRVFFVAFMMALAVFIILDPALYPQPLTQLGRMFKLRTQAMAEQELGFPKDLIVGPVQRIMVVSTRVLQDYQPVNLNNVLWGNILFFGLGVFLLGRKIWLWKDVDKENRDCVLAMAGVLLPMVGMGVLTPLDWDRYYLLPVVFSLWVILYGMVFVIKQALWKINNRSKPEL